MKKTLTQSITYFILVALCVGLNVAAKQNERIAREKRMQELGERGAKALANMKVTDFEGQKPTAAQ